MLVGTGLVGKRHVLLHCAGAASAHEVLGVVADKVQKNLFSSETIYKFIRPMKTVGVLRRDEAKKVIEIAEPFGPVAAIVPSTNPTSTAIYKTLISLKARNSIVMSPHPRATRCVVETCPGSPRRHVSSSGSAGASSASISERSPGSRMELPIIERITARRERGSFQKFMAGMPAR